MAEPLTQKCEQCNDQGYNGTASWCWCADREIRGVAIPRWCPKEANDTITQADEAGLAG